MSFTSSIHPSDPPPATHRLTSSSHRVKLTPYQPHQPHHHRQRSSLSTPSNLKHPLPPHPALTTKKEPLTPIWDGYISTVWRPAQQDKLAAYDQGKDSFVDHKSLLIARRGFNIRPWDLSDPDITQHRVEGFLEWLKLRRTREEGTKWWPNDAEGVVALLKKEKEEQLEKRRKLAAATAAATASQQARQRTLSSASSSSRAGGKSLLERIDLGGSQLLKRKR